MTRLLQTGNHLSKDPKTQSGKEHTWTNVAVLTLDILLTIAPSSSGKILTIASPALLIKWMIKSPMNKLPDSSVDCSCQAMSSRTWSKPLLPAPSCHARICSVSFLTNSVNAVIAY